MEAWTGINGIPAAPRGAVAALGMFDGVHVGHQRLIRTATRLATAARGTSVAITFDPDPRRVLDPDHAPAALMSLAERIERLRELGLDAVWIIRFTPQFSRLPPELFVRRVLVERLRARTVVVGSSFMFGWRREGDLNLLKTLGVEHGFRVVAVAAVRQGGEIVSSSRIRGLIREGRLMQARRLLGRPHVLAGRVLHGVGRGRGLGYPTANVRLDGQLMPPRGVYSVWCEIDGRRWPGVMNLGRRPTFGDGPLTCEVHVLGFEGNLYGHHVQLGLLQRLRDERRFDSARALSRQIARDAARAESVYAHSV